MHVAVAVATAIAIAADVVVVVIVGDAVINVDTHRRCWRVSLVHICVVVVSLLVLADLKFAFSE